MEMKVAPSAGPESNFGLLHPLWPDLHSLAIEAQQNSEKLPAFTAIRLRSFSEAMVRHLFEHHALPMNSDETQLDRLRRLEKERLLNRRVLGMLHTIRKLGNIAAHDKRPVVAEEARSLLEDAWSLASWFCRYLRPDLDWDAQLSSPPLGVTPVSGTFLDASIPTSEDQPTLVRSSVLVTRSDQSVRPPQARISLSDAYEDELNDDQQRCVLALLAFLSDDSQRVFLLKGFAGTGKTFLAAGLTEYLLSQGRMFSLAAPTGRAAKVIAKKTGQSARTIHSLIYDYSDMTEQTEDGEDGSATFKMIAKVRQNQDPIDAISIVDEASLISDIYSESEFFRSGSGHLLRDLIAHVGSTHSGNARKIIFIGDPAQLPPVGMPSSPALDADYLRREFGLDAASYELTEIVRQKADSAVIRNVSAISAHGTV